MKVANATTFRVLIGGSVLVAIGIGLGFMEARDPPNAVRGKARIARSKCSDSCTVFATLVEPVPTELITNDPNLRPIDPMLERTIVNFNKNLPEGTQIDVWIPRAPIDGDLQSTSVNMKPAGALVGMGLLLGMGAGLMIVIPKIPKRTQTKTQIKARRYGRRKEFSDAQVASLQNEMREVDAAFAPIRGVQDVAIVSKAITDDSFYGSEKLIATWNHIVESNNALHIIGLCSNNTNHCQIRHITELARVANERGVSRINVHAIVDCYHDANSTARKDIHGITTFLNALKKSGKNNVFVLTISGRYWAMDCANNWNRTQAAYEAIVNGKGVGARGAMGALKRGAKLGAADALLAPTVISTDSDQQAGAAMQSGDVVIFANARADAMRQLVAAILEPSFTRFRRKAIPDITAFSMCDYGLAVELTNLFP